jgi:intracellular sulfur oxidation DsrE/DsrF family protein
MRAQAVETDELIPGFIRVDQGGVVRIAELQAEGYLYIRP